MRTIKLADGQKLTRPQVKDLETLLDIINSERKSIAFLGLSPDYDTVTDIKERIEIQFPKLDSPLIQNNIDAYIQHIFASGHRGLLKSKTVHGRRYKKRAKAYCLTEKAQDLQYLVSFALTYLPMHHDLSAHAVLGSTNSSGGTRASYTKMQILWLLHCNGEMSLGQLASEVRVRPNHTQNKLNELEEVINFHGDDFPFVQGVVGYPTNAIYAHVWTGKRLDMDDFRYGSGNQIELVRFFSRRPAGTPFYQKELRSHTTYKLTKSLVFALDNLRKKGHLRMEREIDHRTFRLTETGSRYMSDSMSVILEFLRGNPDAIRYVRTHQPTNAQLAYAANIYQKHISAQYSSPIQFPKLIFKTSP